MAEFCNYKIILKGFHKRLKKKPINVTCGMTCVKCVFKIWMQPTKKQKPNLLSYCTSHSCRMFKSKFICVYSIPLTRFKNMMFCKIVWGGILSFINRPEVKMLPIHLQKMKKKNFKNDNMGSASKKTLWEKIIQVHRPVKKKVEFSKMMQQKDRGREDMDGNLTIWEGNFFLFLSQKEKNPNCTRNRLGICPLTDRWASSLSSSVVKSCTLVSS